MSDPSLPLQAAIVAALKASAAVRALAGAPPDTRVYDRVPLDTKLPYVTVGEGLTITDRAECLEGRQTTLSVGCYSNEPGYPEVKRLSAAVQAALHENYTLTVAGFRVVIIEFEDVRYRRDADGLTSIADVNFRVLTEPSS